MQNLKYISDEQNHVNQIFDKSLKILDKELDYNWDQGERLFQIALKREWCGMFAAQCHMKYKAAFKSNGSEADPLSAIHLPVQSVLLQGREAQHHLVLHLGNSSGKASQLCICLGPGATEKNVTEGNTITLFK